MIIAISNPSKQYTHQSVAALSKCAKYDVVFLTSFWFMPGSILWHKWLACFPSIRKQMVKKSSSAVNDKLVVMHWTGILFSFFGRFIFRGEKRSFIEDKIHDQWVAKWVKKNRPDMLIGYEKSCLYSFTAIKEYGGVAVLDLSQVHPIFIETLRNKYDFFKKITGNDLLFTRICKKKMDEYNKADHIVTLSGFAKDTLTENGISKQKISQTTLGYNPLFFKQKMVYRTDHGEPLRLIFCGMVSYRKGIHLLLELMITDLADKNITLDIVGPMGASFTLDTYMKDNDRITYYPYMQHEELVYKLQKSDVFVFPSYLDSWAMVVIEAMACGLPVIVTENTGAKDAVAKEAGFVIPINDKKVLLEKILHYYNDRSNIEVMGMRAAETVISYTWDNYELQLQHIVEKLSCLKLQNEQVF